jgi:hypothetical protein
MLMANIQKNDYILSMKRSVLFYIAVFVALSGCNGQPVSKTKQLFNEDLNWTISIPESFTILADASVRLDNEGVEAVEKTYGDKVSDEPTTIFLFKNGNFNYLEATYKAFDLEEDGSYFESCRDDWQILFETFRTQMPMAKIDSASSREIISGLEFRTFSLIIVFPDGMKWHSLVYNRLFDDKDFSLSIMYIEEEAGRRIIDSWRGSEFQ